MSNEVFYVYVDETNDGRAFYVGKGKERRLLVFQRNKRWHNIANKHGHKRKVILGTKDEGFAFEIEKALIFKYKTFEAKWPKGIGYGANFTDGGDGQAGRVGNLAAMYGKKHSDETKKKISEINSGKNNPMYGTKGELSPNFGKIHSEETKLKIKSSRINLLYDNSSNKNVSALKPHQVLEILKKYFTGSFTQKEIGLEYGVSRRCIGAIVHKKNWKHLSNDVVINKKLFTSNKKKRLSKKGEDSNQAILKEKQVLDIRKKFLTGEYNKMDLSREYGVSRGCIRHIISGKSWSHLLPEKI